MRELRESDHTYWVDGKQYVGVNELLKSEGLFQDLEKVVPAARLEAGRAKGRIVHKIAEFTCKGTLETKTVDKRLLNQKRQIDTFLKDFEVVPVYIEKILWDDNKRFAGTVDLIAKTNKGLLLIDWKSTVVGEGLLQLHTYKMLAKTYLDLDVNLLVEVGLSDDNNYKVKFHELDRQIEIVILSALRIYQYRKDNKLC